MFGWQKGNTDQSNDIENETVNGIYSKLEMYAVRLALILEMMRYACRESDKLAVSVEATQGAIKLVEYFKISAIKVHSIISNVSPLDKQPIDKQNLYRALPNTFTTEQGLQIAKNLDVPERTFKRFLNETSLFRKITRGEYQKV